MSTRATASPPEDGENESNENLTIGEESDRSGNVNLDVIFAFGGYLCGNFNFTR